MAKNDGEKEKACESAQGKTAMKINVYCQPGSPQEVVFKASAADPADPEARSIAGEFVVEICKVAKQFMAAHKERSLAEVDVYMERRGQYDQDLLVSEPRNGRAVAGPWRLTAVLDASSTFFLESK